MWCAIKPRNSAEAGTVTDLVNLAMLMCASVGSMVFGVLAAYGVFRAAFALMRPPKNAAEVKVRRETASV